MSEKKRIRIVSNGRAGNDGDTQVFIDGVDVTNSVTHVAWSLGVDHASRATITFTPAALEVEYVAEEREKSA